MRDSFVPASHSFLVRLHKAPFHNFLDKMSGKYVFSKALKELRFLHCQTSEHSNAVRYVL